jgi:ankyrin repeat protein
MSNELGIIGIMASTASQSVQLIEAGKSGDVQAVRALLSGSMGVDSVAGFIDSCDGGGMTAFHWAAFGGKTEVVQLLLDGGADIQAENNRGYTALHYASERGIVDVVQLLLDRGADMQAENKEGETPLDLARTDAVSDALNIHPSVRILLKAAKTGNVDTVRNLLSGSMPGMGESLVDFINEGNEYGWTALHLASEKGHTDVVQLLLDRGANKEIKDIVSGPAVHDGGGN